MQHKYFSYFSEVKRAHYINEDRINQRIVWLEKNKWKRNKMNVICFLVKEWRVEKLMTYSNGEPYILREIENIHFPFLWKISLVNNYIQSIEGLHRVKMPMLTDLLINENKILSLKDFRKSSFSNLRKLNICFNPINEGQALTSMGSPNICLLVLDFERQDLIVSYDCHWIVKMQTKQLQKLNIASEERIEEEEFFRIVQDKLKRIKIYTQSYSLLDEESSENRFYHTRILNTEDRMLSEEHYLKMMKWRRRRYGY